jgi:hypothetical protein
MINGLTDAMLLTFQGWLRFEHILTIANWWLALPDKQQ